MADSLFDPTIAGLNAAMNFRTANQNVITSNIANADTPGYHAQKMEFEGALRDALNVSNRLQMAADDADHFAKSEPGTIDPVIYDNPNGVMNLDGNTVDRASEMVALSENELNYNTAAELLKKKLGLLKYSINEGGGGR